MLAKEASEKEGTLDVSAAKVELMKISGAVTKIDEGGRAIHIGDKSAAISGSRTELTIDGKPGDRANVKMGMMCEAELTGDNGSEAKTFSCK
jgi:hypothetical protein